MIRFSLGDSSLRLRAAFSGLAAAFALTSTASALDLDFNVASGNYITTSNWTDTTNFPVNVPAAAAPTIGDTAWIRNGGTVTVNSDISATDIRVGGRRGITPPDYNGDGLIDAADYVMYRKGGTLQNDSTAGTVGPEDYDLWRMRYGTTSADNNIGGSGAMMWTAGEITGPTGFHTGGPSLQIGRHINLSPTQLVEYDFPGQVVQNGATTKIMLVAPESRINIGENGTTPNPQNSYTLQNGTIGTAIGGAGLDGANGNNGINVKNGYFTMTGGQIIDATPDDLRAGTLTTQRFLTIGGQSGPANASPGQENFAQATLTGGTIDVLGGIRIAPSSNSKGILNINGPITITTGGDTSVGYNATNGVGEMNMSAGTLNVGRVYTDPVSGSVNSLIGRFQVGHRGKGTLNMSGGTINVTREIRVGAEYAAGGSVINMTGGAITTVALLTSIANSDPLAPGYLGSSIIIDGPSASFTQLGAAGAIIGNQGKGLFEVRQGTAILGSSGSATSPGFINVGAQATSEATINVKGGKLVVGGTLGYSLTAFPSGLPANPVNLTGGTLEFNNPLNANAQSWQPNFVNTGSKLVLTQNALRQVNVGQVSPAYPSDWSMTSGSWDIELGLNTVLGADWFNVQNGVGALSGGTINISYLSGFTPNVGQVYRILRAAKGTTLGSISITGAGAGGWILQEAPITNVNFPLDEEIQLKYVGPGAGSGFENATVPEPSSFALVAFALFGLLTGRKSRVPAAAPRG